MSRWTEPLIEDLRRLAAAGQSATQIGVALGFTRNAIVGKAARIGLSLHGSSGRRNSPRPDKPRQKAKQKPAKPQPHPGNIRSKKEARASDPVFVAPITDADARRYDESARALPLVEVGRRQCKFPVNEAGEGEPHLFCARPAKGSWCDHHRRRINGRGTESERTATRVLERAAS